MRKYSKRINQKIKIAAKYKIDEPKFYTRVEYIHPQSGKHEIVEFSPDAEMQGMSWVERPKEVSKLAWFMLGVGWATLLTWIAWMFVRW